MFPKGGLEPVVSVVSKRRGVVGLGEGTGGLRGGGCGGGALADYIGHSAERSRNWPIFLVSSFSYVIIFREGRRHF